MSDKRLHLASLTASLIISIVLIWMTFDALPDATDLLLAALFSVLLVFTTAFGVPLGEGWASLLPMTTVVAYLVVGLPLAAWAAFAGALLHSGVRYHFARQLGVKRRANRLERLGLAFANATIQATSILCGGVVFQALGGVAPLDNAGWGNAPSLALLGLTHLGVNLLLAGLHFGARDRTMLRRYLHALPSLVLYEGAPLVFAPLMALTYVQLGLLQFVIFASALVVSSLLTHRLARSRERLQRRLKELHSLQAVGQALSASLDIHVILPAIYTQVSGLMSTRNFYVALYDAESDTVSFPLSIQDGEPVHWAPRRAGDGLTEHIVKSRQPLLVERDFEASLERLGLGYRGPAAASWLGVPLLAGAESLGAIVVQSYQTPDAYDQSHQEILTTIASQAAIAIQNAYLYARTDQALARRVQELDSIFRTTQEGILLLDLEWRVLAVNRALMNLAGAAQAEWSGKMLHAPDPGGAPPLSVLIAYKLDELQADCQALHQGESDFIRQAIVLPGPPECPVERTLAPVRKPGGTISGWLLVLRDLTEEQELERLREELTHMLIHDLRSPMTVLKGVVDLIHTHVKPDDPMLNRLLTMAQQSSERLLRMISNLLEISKFESGRMLIYPEMINAGDLLQDIAAQLAPLATEAQITLQLSIQPGLPPLYADPQIIERVYTNLLDNAIKFTPDGGNIHVQAQLDTREGTPAILVSVSDDGPGIAQEEQPNLFKKFQVLTRDGRRRGTGLGLPFCKLAVDAHQGRIWVNSELGQGSTFLVWLPIIEPQYEQTMQGEI